MTNSRRLLFITSLERSGSTVLDLYLGKHPSLVSFGEVARVLKPHGKGGIDSVMSRPCSCGEQADSCVFWKDVLREIKANESQLNLVDRYEIFLAHFGRLFGEDRVPVDSSKFLVAIDALEPLTKKGLELHVLFTIRDVRGWCVSSRSAAGRKREIPFGNILKSDFRPFWKAYLRHNFLRYLPFWLPLEWYLRNGKIDRYLRCRLFPVMKISYEQFAFETDKVLEEIFESLGVSRIGLMESSDTHIIRGNRMAFEQKMPEITYDGSWLDDLWTQYEVMFWPFVMIRNRDWVYAWRKSRKGKLKT